MANSPIIYRGNKAYNLKPELESQTLTLTATGNQAVFGTTNTTTLSFTAPGASRVYTFPDAGTNANVVLTQGSQTIAGATTLSSALTITPTTNQLVLGTTNTTTISATAPSASRVYTIPDAGGAANFLLSAGAQSISGALTLTATITPLTLDAGGGAEQRLLMTGSGTNPDLYVEFAATAGTAQSWQFGINPGGVSSNALGIWDDTAGTVVFTVAPTTNDIYFYKPVYLNAASNQLTLASSVNQLTLNSGTSAAARTYTVPDVGTTANFVMTEGAQTIAGAKTFSSTIVGDINGNAGTVTNGAYVNAANTFTLAQTISAASNQVVLSSGVNQLTLNSGTSAAARTYTVPDVGTTANFVMTAGAQTIAGAKTFSDDLTVGSTALFVDVSTGNVGIGTSSPISPFHVVGAPGVATRVLTLNNSTTSATDSLVAFVIEGTNRGFAGADTSNCFKVIGSAGGSAVRMTITDAGAVTLGPSGTTEHLVNGALKIKTTGSTAALVFAHRNDEVNNWQVGKDDSGLGGTDGFYFFSYGIPNYVGGISTAGAWTLGPSGGSVTHKAYGTFEVYNTSPSQGFIFNPNSTSGFFLGGGVIASGAGTHFLKWNSGTGIVTYDTSSILVKEKIQDSPYGLASVMQLQPRKYYRTDDQKDEIGFIADEVKEIVPELVSWMEKKNITRNEDDTELVPATLDYGKMTSVLVKAIQELKAELDALKGA